MLLSQGFFSVLFLSIYDLIVNQILEKWNTQCHSYNLLFHKINGGFYELC
ncbi:Uncharacterised protein [Legionella pneumophila]|nr:Uncharacterised protein [Legionella pneumophila]CZG42136.1 Uncharacterised protein [Legionella pneumophila]CZG43879.1 Uncharacterised protein [Legionella pneumophila]CZG45711.1 Uncharacterised protein [Legionella pneumophila]CZG50440.1 Uncharacterised protein [Legionella pneumophila]